MFVIHIYEKAAHGIKTTHRLSAAIYHLFPLNRHIQHSAVLGGGKIEYFIMNHSHLCFQQILRRDI